MKELPKSLQERLAGISRAPVTANLVEVRDEVAVIERRVEEKVEAERVEAVITGAYKGQDATLGLADTLWAIQQGRVHILVIPVSFRHIVVQVLVKTPNLPNKAGYGKIYKVKYTNYKTHFSYCFSGDVAKW